MQICGITNKMGRGNMPLNDGNTCNSGSGRLWNTNSGDDPPWHRTFIESIVYLVYWILHARTFVFLRSLTIPNCPTIMQSHQKQRRVPQWILNTNGRFIPVQHRAQWYVLPMSTHDWQSVSKRSLYRYILNDVLISWYTLMDLYSLRRTLF